MSHTDNNKKSRINPIFTVINNQKAKLKFFSLAFFNQNQNLINYYFLDYRLLLTYQFLDINQKPNLEIYIIFHRCIVFQSLLIEYTSNFMNFFNQKHKAFHL
jgi:hypothetical protein